jgi:hypothetical protein
MKLETIVIDLKSSNRLQFLISLSMSDTRVITLFAILTRNEGHVQSKKGKSLNITGQI